MSMLGAPQDAGTVQVRVQVIDLEPFALDLVVPTYLPARDLTQRVARDAGLGAYWEDGTRRLFWLRARGRLMQDDERLQDLGVVAHELLHLLPQPPDGAGVMERAPEYPPNKGYAGAGWLNVMGALLMLLVWTAGWSLALTVSQSLLTGLLPALGLALLATSFSRHLWGGQGSAIRIPVTALLVYSSLLVLAVVPVAIFAEASPLSLALAIAPAIIGGLFGVMLGWLAWYGAVEPLPKPTPAAQRLQDAAHAAVPCGICGGPVTPDVKTECVFACGRSFHSGCYKARQSLSRADGCAVCGFRPS
jgi:hypothetical protein